MRRGAAPTRVRLMLKGVVAMAHSTLRRQTVALLAIGLLACACAGANPSIPARPSLDSATPPSDRPAITPSPAPSPSVTAAMSAAEPPAASLAVEGGDPVTGQLGTFTWGDGGSDSPWLPGSPIAVGTGEALTVSIAGPVAVATWSAKRIPEGAVDGSGATGLGTGGPPIAFDAPETGSWSVQVTVDFDDGLGSATYYWLVTVR
jgi:hypothetical protein